MSLKEKKKMELSSFSNWETIEIDHRVYSRNTIDRKHWAWKSNLRKQYQILVRNQMRLNDIKQTKDKCRIIINCYLTRMMDMDNVWGGLKNMIDSLTRENFIHDDSPTWLQIDQVKQIKSKEAKIVVSRLILE